MRDDLRLVADPIAIGISHQWIRAMQEELIRVTQSIPVSVGVVGMRAVIELRGVVQTIAIRVARRVIRSNRQPIRLLPYIRQTVSIGIRRGLRFDLQLKDPDESVRIGSRHPLVFTNDPNRRNPLYRRIQREDRRGGSRVRLVAPPDQMPLEHVHVIGGAGDL